MKPFDDAGQILASFRELVATLDVPGITFECGVLHGAFYGEFYYRAVSKFQVNGGFQVSAKGPLNFPDWRHGPTKVEVLGQLRLAAAEAFGHAVAQNFRADGCYPFAVESSID